MDILKHYKTAKQDAEEFMGRPISDKAYDEFSGSFVKEQPKTQEEVIEFYKHSNYIEELAKWHDEDKKNSVRKFYKALGSVTGTSILDLGAGIGSDSMMLKDAGYAVTYYEINKGCVDFAQWRFKKYNLDIPVIHKLEGNYDCIAFFDVIGHILDPYTFLTELAQHTNQLLFTVDIGVHDERKGGHPQHYDHSRAKVFKHLESLGFKKVKLNMAFPPQLWVKQ